jgi:hypothetical protein
VQKEISTNTTAFSPHRAPPEGKVNRSGKKRLRSVGLTGRQNLLAAPFHSNARDVPKRRRHFCAAAPLPPLSADSPIKKGVSGDAWALEKISARWFFRGDALQSSVEAQF